MIMISINDHINIIHINNNDNTGVCKTNGRSKTMRTNPARTLTLFCAVFVRIRRLRKSP